MNAKFKYAKLGSISHGTLRTVDLLNAFHSELEGMVLLNGDFFSLPENFPLRDRLNTILSECHDLFNDEGEEIRDDKQDEAEEMVNETLPDALNSHFAPAYATFRAHEGDGADFGYWPNIDEAKESCEFVSSEAQEFPDDDFSGEWLHINERGNCTLYVRTEGKDAEIWSIV